MRIVAGHAKGRRLSTPAGATRPTSDRAREALFNAVAGQLDLNGAHVLDLYAGTGAVGLEALSRGAARAVLVESNRAALDVLRRNVATVALSGARVVGRPVLSYLDDDPPQRPFDLAFVDPPYALAESALAAVLAALACDGWLVAEAVVVVERGARGPEPAWPDGIDVARHRRYGDSLLWYGRRR